MNTVKLSPKFQIVIPSDFRKSLNLKAGQLLCLIHYNERIELVPVKTISDMRGFVKGISTKIEREEDRL